MSIVRRIGQGLLFILSVPLLIALVLVVLAGAAIVAPFAIAHRWARARRFRLEHEGRLFLVGTRRAGWNEFTTNNVIPALPADVICVWHDSTSREGKLTGALREFREAGLGGPKPFHVRVTRSRLIQIPLHESLRPLQPHAARDPEVQGEVRSRVFLALAGT